MGGCIYPPPPYEFVEATNPRAILLETVIRPNEEIRSKNFQRLEVRFRKNRIPYKYEVLIGPFPYKVIPPAVVPDAVARYRNLIPLFSLEQGWICLAGECPYAETELVIATGHGSNVTMVVWIDGTTHRVFLLRRTGREVATVTLKGQPINSDTRKEWTADVDRFVEAYPGAPPTLTAPLAVSSAAPEIRQFVADMNQFMAEVGMTDAPPLP